MLLGCATAKVGSDADAKSAPLSTGDVVSDASQVKKGTTFPACDPKATTQRVSFVHVNDLHANYQLGTDGISPVARIRGYLGQARQVNPFTVFTDGGDDYEKGSVADQLSQGKSTTAIVHALQFDVRVIGNHDYAWNEQTVLEDSRDPYAQVLSSNIHYTGSDPKGFGAVDFVKLQVGCLTVGFAGFTSQPWDSTDSQIDANFYPTFPANYDFLAQAKAMVAEHRKEVDVLVFLDHIGQDVDKNLAGAVPGIDAVLSAHSHTFTPVPEYNGKSAPVVQSGAYATHVVRLDLDVDLGTRQITQVGFDAADLSAGSALPVDADTQAFVAKTLKQYAPLADTPIGYVANAGGQDAAAALAARACAQVLQVDAALIDTSTAWAFFLAGGMTQQQMVKMFTVEREPSGTPGFNSAYTAWVMGSDLQKLAALDSKWAYVGPKTIDPTQPYTLALQKRPALNPGHMPAGVKVQEPQAALEMWQVLDMYARQRTKACKYMDSDDALSPCP